CFPSVCSVDCVHRNISHTPARADVACCLNRSGFHRLQRTTAAVDPEQEKARASTRISARPEGISRTALHTLAVTLSLRASVCISRRWSEIQSSVPAWRIEYRDVRRQLQLEGAGVAAG